MYALWLLPDSENQKSLTQLIDRLSDDYNGPRFDPHLTLLGRLEGQEDKLILQASALVKNLKPFNLRTISIEYQDYFYKSLFIKMDTSNALEHARYSAEVLFRHMPDQDFMPHFSLMYGSHNDQGKEYLSKKLMNEILFEYKVDKIRLVAAFGSVNKWKTIIELSLHN